MRQGVHLHIESTVGDARYEIDQFLRTNWLAGLPANWQGHVWVHHVVSWNGMIQQMFVYVQAVGDRYTTSGIIRSATVDVLTLVTDPVGHRKFVAFVQQDRHLAAAGVVSNIAGGIDPGEGWKEAGLREVREEFKLRRGVVDLQIEQLPVAQVLASPGMINEVTHMLRARITLDSQMLDHLLEKKEGWKAGVEAEGEDLTVRLVSVDEAYAWLLQQPPVDAKTLLSLQLAGYGRSAA